MPKQKTYRIPANLYAAIMRQRFVWTPQARAAVERESLRLHCAQFGHKMAGGTCSNCGLEQGVRHG